ncbi:transcription termination factor 3, mitochondrial [Thalassophryne amazonica]|uniref:transcription termination factor 3, mitochondrial n=1 Tax=Thalassophryne amazonica TaxID=390379 RepID=UPI001470D2C6|nr:transcription termination factor 3, mitochondrial [Thalassophryne amazonica]
MASSCAQLCLRCRSLLCSKTAGVTWQYSTQVRHCTSVTGGLTQIFAGSLFISGRNKRPQCSQRWKQQTCFYSDLTGRSVVPGAHENKELTKTDAVAHRSPPLQFEDAVPLTESHVSLDLDVAEFSALEEINDEEAVSVTVPPAIPPASTSLRDYVDKSETLTKLVQLGVNLWKLEQRPNVGSMLLKLDFQTDVAPRLLFLKDIGVEDSCLGNLITYNPFILTEDLENLQTRVDYLRSQKFSPDTIASMVSRAPYLLNFSVKRLDNRLGFYQQQLGLSASNTRNIVSRLPRLLCGSLEPVKENLKVCNIELGFKENEIQQIVLAVPKVLTANKMKLTQIFDFVHNTMHIPHHLIVKFPQVLNTSKLRLRERHLFLQYLEKAQYDPTQPNYISLDQLVSLPNNIFCTKVASATLEDYYMFLKTL